jgi:hypothetical protein
MDGLERAELLCDEPHVKYNSGLGGSIIIILTSILSRSSVAVGAETRMRRPAMLRNPSSTALSNSVKSAS